MAAGRSYTDPLQDRARNTPRVPSEDAQSVGGELKETAKREGSAVWNETKDAASAMLGEQQKSAASGVGELASALRKVARDMPGGDGGARPQMSKLIESAADGLERFSGSLKNRDLNSLVGDVEAFAKRQPIVFFGAAVAAGFLAMRFLKASNRPERERGSPASEAGNLPGNLPF